MIPKKRPATTRRQNLFITGWEGPPHNVLLKKTFIASKVTNVNVEVNNPLKTRPVRVSGGLIPKYPPTHPPTIPPAAQAGHPINHSPFYGNYSRRFRPSKMVFEWMKCEKIGEINSFFLLMSRFLKPIVIQTHLGSAYTYVNSYLLCISCQFFEHSLFSKFLERDNLASD
jgi:hypothetical protein